MPTTAATAVTEAPAPPWTIWTGQYSGAAIPDGATVQPVSKVWCDDCQGAAKCTTSVTAMPCSIPSAGPSWTTPILNFTTTAAMRPTGRSPAAVSTPPPFHIRHLVWGDLSKSTMALTFCVHLFQARTMNARCSSASVTARPLNVSAGRIGTLNMSTCPVSTVSENPSIQHCTWTRTVTVYEMRFCSRTDSINKVVASLIWTSYTQQFMLCIIQVYVFSFCKLNVLLDLTAKFYYTHTNTHACSLVASWLPVVHICPLWRTFGNLNVSHPQHAMQDSWWTVMWLLNPGIFFGTN